MPSPAAEEAGSGGGEGGSSSRDLDELLSLVPVKKVQGEKNDQEAKNADRPEKPLGEGVPVLLGIKINPHGDDHRNHENDKKGTHPEFSPKNSDPRSAFSCQKKNSIKKS